MALMLLVSAIGWRIPLPGIDMARVAGTYSPPGDAWSRLSIFALYVLPLFTVLAYWEIATLAIRPLARWLNQRAQNARRLGIIVLSLVVAVWQGQGILSALVAMDIASPDSMGFPPAGLATFIASTALLAWMADGFGLGRIGEGFWVLMAIAFLASFPARISTLLDLHQTGNIPGDHLLIVALLLLAAGALVAFANLLSSRNIRADTRTRTSLLLWPPYLADVVARHALTLLPSDMPGWPYLTPSVSEIAYLAIVAICIPLFVFAYSGCLPVPRPGYPFQPLKPVLTVIAAVQVLLCLGLWLLPEYLGIPSPVSGGELLVTGTVMVSLRRAPETFG